MGGPHFPTTQEIGFLETDLETVVTGFVAWLTRLGQKPNQRSIVGGGLHEGLHELLPLTVADRRRFVFFKVSQAWTAFFDNGARGTDAASKGPYLARTLGCRGLRVVSAPDDNRTYGACILEVYGPEPTDSLNYIRTVGVANDGGRWRFHTSGAPFSFEDLSAYKRRRIRDRFTHEMLANYLDALGVSAFSPGSYTEPVLVERGDAEPSNIEHLSFEQAEARFAR